MSQKDKWIDDVENSLHGMSPAPANPFLFTRILSRMESKPTAYNPARLVWLGASLALLIVLNVMAIKTLGQNNRPQKKELQSLSDQFQLMNTNTITYN